ncbi:MAG: type II toxin-antitoxin system HicB family antitoxin [Tepidisphaeraceae bacterium]
MSARSKTSSGDRRNRRKRIDRPFAPKILARAAEIANAYRIVLENNPDGGYVGYSLELPHCYGDGRTADACVSNTRQAVISVVAYMLERGQVPPSPTRDDRRDQQVNIRLTAEEKLMLEEAARQHGFRGVSDFVRSRTLSNVAEPASPDRG